MFSPKCVFSEMDHHTASKLVPLQSACLKLQGALSLAPLNTKESDVLAQNVLSQKQIHIWLENLYNCNWHAETSGCAKFGSLNTKDSDVLAQNDLFCCFSIYSLMHLLTRPMS